MKQTVKIAFCGLMAAMGTAFMLLSYFPYFTYAVPALSGVLVLFVMIEAKGKWPIFTYIVTAVLVGIFAEPEAKGMYILFFGYYPILKAGIERVKSRVVQYLLKFAVFNAAILVLYGLLAGITGIDISEFGVYGLIGKIAFILAANVAFYLYDIVLVRMADWYLRILHGKVKRIFK